MLVTVKQNTAEISKKIAETIKGVIPDIEFRHNSDGMLGDYIRVVISHPEPYLGSLSQGKVHWTINLREIATYSRTRQVRVRVGGDNCVSFNIETFLGHINTLKFIVDDYKLEQEKKKRSMGLLPQLPSNVSVVPRGECLYEIRICRTTDLAGVNKFVTLTQEEDSRLKLSKKTDSKEEE